MSKRRPALFRRLVLVAVTTIFVLGWLFVGIPYYWNPPQPPYDQPSLIGPELVFSGCTGCSGLLFLGYGVVYWVERRGRK